ncbi:MerR family transcriptional regulator [Listeria valentina]|uniref:MerR family transcriptional regulator n=1 Tax=Listeria valentina TaxID=2705293 RepID=UPI0014310778|nr:MerR family transcriptional regulator [Listeria valentina]
MNIKKISEKYKITPDTLRYWERIGAIPPVNRNPSGYRDYDKEDEDWIVWTLRMKNAGVSLERIIEYIQLFIQGDQTIETRKELLREQLSVIDERRSEIQQMYEALEEKIENYEEHMLKYEGKLKKHKEELLLKEFLFIYYCIFYYHK